MNILYMLLGAYIWGMVDAWICACLLEKAQSDPDCPLEATDLFLLGILWPVKTFNAICMLFSDDDVELH